MSALTIYSDHVTHQPKWYSENPEDIGSRLATKGIRFQRWQADCDLGDAPRAETVLTAYRSLIERLVTDKGYQSWDVISMRANNPQKVTLRSKFLAEHTHSEDEVRFFVEGAGLFCLHLGDEVYQVLCERNDLISVPAGTAHWFDMGSEPHFTAIRFFSNQEGWIAHFTGNSISDAFPRLS